MMGKMDIREQLEREAKLLGVKVRWVNEGHCHLMGALLVNYYPFSAKRTAYIAGTTGGYHNINPFQALHMALTPPPIAEKERKASRHYQSRQLRIKMLRGCICCRCHWCETIIDLNTSTIDHEIPLHRGGLDHDNNRVLACEPCNKRRGHAMPEVAERASKLKRGTHG